MLPPIFNCDPGDECELEPWLAVEVELINDNGDRVTTLATGRSTDEAVALAEEQVRMQTGDDSYVMNEWGGR